MLKATVIPINESFHDQYFFYSTISTFENTIVDKSFKNNRKYLEILKIILLEKKPVRNKM